MIRRFRRRRRSVHVPPHVVYRQMLYDAMQDVSDLGGLGGLAPVSDEVDEMERAASQQRLERISYLHPCLMDQSQWLSNLAVMVQLRELDKIGHESTAEEVEQLRRMFLALVRSSVVGSISTLVGLGLLEVPEDER